MGGPQPNMGSHFNQQPGSVLGASNSSTVQGGSSKATGNFFRRNASNQSGKQKGTTSVASSSSHLNAGSNMQAHGHHYPAQKHTPVGQRQNSGHGSHHGMHHGSNNNSQRIMHQQAPQSHYQPKTKIIQIGAGTSPKVSPKNIKELLKFRVGASGQGPANVTN